MPPPPAKRGRKAAFQTILHAKDIKVLTKKYNRLKKVTGAKIEVNFDELTDCPRDINQDDWIVINAAEFLTRVELLYSSCSLFCTQETCPMFNAGPHYHYFWEDEETQKPIQLSAPEYFQHLKRWARRTLKDPAIVPTDIGVNLSEDGATKLRSVFRRLFRIISHMYICHFSSIREFNMEPVINTMLMHYTTFGFKFALISATDIEMLEPVFTAMNRPLSGLGPSG